MYVNQQSFGSSETKINNPNSILFSHYLLLLSHHLRLACLIRSIVTPVIYGIFDNPAFFVTLPRPATFLCPSIFNFFAFIVYFYCVKVSVWKDVTVEKYSLQNYYDSENREKHGLNPSRRHSNLAESVEAAC